MLYYIYCIEMGRPHEEFIKSSLGKVLTMVIIHTQVKNGKVTRNKNQQKKTTRQILGL